MSNKTKATILYVYRSLNDLLNKEFNFAPYLERLDQVRESSVRSENVEKRAIVSEMQNALKDFLSKAFSDYDLDWDIEYHFNSGHQDSIDIYAHNDDLQVIIEIDATRADQLAKKIVSRFTDINQPTIYVALLYRGTAKMNAKECEKYFGYAKQLIQKIQPDSCFMGVIKK